MSTDRGEHSGDGSSWKIPFRPISAHFERCSAAMMLASRIPRSVWMGLFLFLSAPRAKAESHAWCAPEVEVLADGLCYYAPRNEDVPRAGPATLVLFLHSLVGVQSTWQWEQQRLLLRAANTHGFSVLMPRGRIGIGPGRAPDVWAWPTSAQAQEQLEAELVDEWGQARAKIEQSSGRAFERLYVFGFSNGAYYAASLALRNRLQAQGYGVFAGGSGGRYAALLGSRTSDRAPIFVGYGTKDPARKDMQSLVETLKRLGWRHGVKSEPVGHIVTDAQLSAALRYLKASRSERGSAESP
jgi:predicted esterase